MSTSLCRSGEGGAARTGSFYGILACFTVSNAGPRHEACSAHAAHTSLCCIPTLYSFSSPDYNEAPVGKSVGVCFHLPVTLSTCPPPSLLPICLPLPPSLWKSHPSFSNPENTPEGEMIPLFNTCGLDTWLTHRVLQPQWDPVLSRPTAWLHWVRVAGTNLTFPMPAAPIPPSVTQRTPAHRGR